MPTFVAKCLEKSTAYELNYGEAHINKFEICWQNVLWSNESKLSFSRMNNRWYIWQAPSTAFEDKVLIPTIEH